MFLSWKLSLLHWYVCHIFAINLVYHTLVTLPKGMVPSYLSPFLFTDDSSYMDTQGIRVGKWWIWKPFLYVCCHGIFWTKVTHVAEKKAGMWGKTGVRSRSKSIITLLSNTVDFCEIKVFVEQHCTIRFVWKLFLNYEKQVLMSMYPIYVL